MQCVHKVIYDLPYSVRVPILHLTEEITFPPSGEDLGK